MEVETGNVVLHPKERERREAREVTDEFLAEKQAQDDTQTVQAIRENLSFYFEKHSQEHGCGADDECQVGWAIWNCYWIAMYGQLPGGWGKADLKVADDDSPEASSE